MHQHTTKRRYIQDRTNNLLMKLFYIAQQRTKEYKMVLNMKKILELQSVKIKMSYSYSRPVMFDYQLQFTPIAYN